MLMEFWNSEIAIIICASAIFVLVSNIEVLKMSNGLMGNENKELFLARL